MHDKENYDRSTSKDHHLFDRDESDVNSVIGTDEKGQFLLHEAVSKNHFNMVNKLLRRGYDVNVKNEVGMTPLHLACKKGLFKIVKLLLENDGDINEVCGLRKCTALFYAAMYGQEDIIKLLLLYKPNVDKNCNGVNVLTIASFCGWVGIVELLLNYGANVNLSSDVTSDTPLFTAAQEGRADIVTCLIKHGADVNKTCSFQETALHISSELGHVEVCKILLENGANVNLKSAHDDYTPLHFAARRGHEKVISLLLIYGADVNAQDNLGNTALHKARQEEHVNVVRLLTEFIMIGELTVESQCL